MATQDVNYPDSAIIVDSFEELLATKFTKTQNIIIFPRDLPAGFETIAREIKEEATKGIRSWYENRRTISNMADSKSLGFEWSKLEKLMSRSDNDIKEAAAILREDKEKFGQYQFRVHWDRADNERHLDGPSKNGRILTCYTNPTTNGWRQQDINVQTFKTKDNEIDVRATDWSFKKPDARPFSMSVGDIWRFTTKQSVLEGLAPFLHEDPPLDEGGIRMLALGTCYELIR